MNEREPPRRGNGPPQAQALLDDLWARARNWLPEWQPRADNRDFGRAMLEIAARLGGEVTQRLARVPEKSRRGFIHWLGLDGAGARAARLPVVFGMTAAAEPIHAEAGVQVQAQTKDGNAVLLETEQPLRMLPGRLQHLVAADPARNAFHLPPPGVLALEPPKAAAQRWRLLAEARAEDVQVQLEATEGLAMGHMVVDEKAALHRVTAIDERMVTLWPALATDLKSGSRLTLEPAFRPAEHWLNEQAHAVYLGAEELLKIEGAAVIEVVGSEPFADGADWWYWGKSDSKGKDAASDWQRLTPLAGTPTLQLVKPPGDIEVIEIDGRKSRWLRATREPADLRGQKASTGSHIGLRIVGNPAAWSTDFRERVAAQVDKKLDAAFGESTLQLDGMANTAPLMLEAPFYPLGREPRLFDAFYLGCGEAFSKGGASVELRFSVDDQLGSAMVAAGVGSDGGHLMLAGIGRDGRLIRLKVTPSGKDDPPAIEVLASVQPQDVYQRQIVLSSKARPGAAWHNGVTSFSAVEVGATGQPVFWLYELAGLSKEIGWTPLGFPSHTSSGGQTPWPQEPGPYHTALIGGSALGALTAFVVVDGQLHWRVPNGSAGWKVVAGAQRRIETISPVLGREGARKLVCVQDDGSVHLLSVDAMETAAGWEAIGSSMRLDPHVYPAAHESSKKPLQVVGKKLGSDALCAFAAGSAKVSELEMVLLGGALALAEQDGEVVAYATVRKDGKPCALRWAPISAPTVSVTGPSPNGSKPLGGAPVLVGKDLVFPVDKVGMYVPIPKVRSSTEIADVELTDALLVKARPAFEELSALFVRPRRKGSGRCVSVKLIHALPPRQQAIVLEERIGDPDPKVDLFCANGESFPCWRIESQDSVLIVEHPDIAEDQQLGVQGDHYRGVHKVIKAVRDGPKVVVNILPPLPSGARVRTCRKVRPVRTPELAFLPAISAKKLGALAPLADLVAFGTLEIDKWQPGRHRPMAVTSENLPEAWILLPQSSWAAITPAEATQIHVKGSIREAFHEWHLGGGDSPRNPALSWEYWDGHSWRRIEGVKDGTGHLINSASVSFDVPTDLAPTDVMGRKNHWIRARLVGGNYGEESVILQPAPGAPASGPQVVTRSTATIRAPYVVALTLAYWQKDSALPDIVLTQDSGAVIDQTGANRAPNAIVRYFVPLADTLGHFDAPGTADPSDRPAIYLGFDRPPSGGPVSLMFLVEEGGPSDVAPLEVAALRRNGFEKLAVEDHSFALQESGTLVLQVDEPPESAQLFGQTAWWLRLRPGDRRVVDWSPAILGAWLNGSWAAAAETRHEELLGSSDGSPGQRFWLAHPPVIAHSLELRVREHLGDEERVLRRAGRGVVVDELGHRPGPWVLWTCVGDTDDAGPLERVYALDDLTGEIRFGDGRRGRIPPKGADTILARRYRRGGGAAANDLKAWTQLQLVTPLRGIDTVIAPDGAAGGADAQDAAAVMRFAPDNLFLRDRAVSPRDLAAIARQFSPDIAQVMPVEGPAGSLRLVVAMRGRDPRPTRAVRRELRTFLAERALPSLVAPDCLGIVGPDLRPLRVRAVLRVDRLEHSGQVAQQATDRIAALLDPATGGLDGRGWPIGAWPSDDEIATALSAIEAVAEITEVQVERLDPRSGEPVAGLPCLGPTDLAVPDPLGVRCELELPESELEP